MMARLGYILSEGLLNCSYSGSCPSCIMLTLPVPTMHFLVRIWNTAGFEGLWILSVVSKLCSRVLNNNRKRMARRACESGNSWPSLSGYSLCSRFFPVGDLYISKTCQQNEPKSSPIPYMREENAFFSAVTWKTCSLIWSYVR